MHVRFQIPYPILVVLSTLVLIPFHSIAQDTLFLKNDSYLLGQICKISMDSIYLDVNTEYDRLNLVFPLTKVEKYSLANPDSKFNVYRDTTLRTKALELRRKGMMMAVYSEERKLSSFEVKYILLPFDKSYKNYNIGRSMKIVGTVLIYPGTMMLGYSFLVISGGWAFNPYFLAAGAGLVIIGLNLSISGNKRIKTAINTYNSSFQAYKRASYINFGIQQHGIGVSYRF
ncbi:MAG: hypothetical protein KAH25_03385 [Bacteroidales bacterium]|nr:hypothetical protein [Bacteroidales bacterium]